MQPQRRGTAHTVHLTQQETTTAVQQRRRKHRMYIPVHRNHTLGRVYPLARQIYAIGCWFLEGWWETGIFSSPRASIAAGIYQSNKQVPNCPILQWATQGYYKRQRQTKIPCCFHLIRVHDSTIKTSLSGNGVSMVTCFMHVRRVSQCFRGSLWREGSYQESGVWWDQIHSVLVDRFGEKAVYGIRVDRRAMT